MVFLVFDGCVIVNLLDVHKVIQLFLKFDIRLSLMIKLSLLVLCLRCKRESHVKQKCFLQIHKVWIERSSTSCNQHSEFPFEPVHQGEAMLLLASIACFNGNTTILVSKLDGDGTTIWSIPDDSLAAGLTVDLHRIDQFLAIINESLNVVHSRRLSKQDCV